MVKPLGLNEIEKKVKYTTIPLSEKHDPD